jgi:hypothetical protein
VFEQVVKDVMLECRYRHVIGGIQHLSKALISERLTV